LWYQPAPPCAPASEIDTGEKCPAGQTGTITKQRDYTCPAASWSAWRVTSNTCIKYCSVTLSVDPTFINGETGSTTLTATVYQPRPTSGVLDFGDLTTSVPLVEGTTNTFVHTYNGKGIYVAKAKCTGDDGDLHEVSAQFELKNPPKPCPDLCTNIKKTLVVGTADQLSPEPLADSLLNDYRTVPNAAGTKDKDVDTNLTAMVGDVFSATWNYLSGWPGVVVKTTPGGKATSWFDPIGQPLRFTRYGDYSFNLVGVNPGMYNDANNIKYYECKVCPVTVNIVRPACKITDEIKSEPVKPVANPPIVPTDSFIASNMAPLPITFSAQMSGIDKVHNASDPADPSYYGIQSWNLQKKISGTFQNIVCPATNLDCATISLDPNDKMPTGTFTFAGDDDLANDKFGSGEYRLQLIGSSMVDSTGKLDPDGKCEKAFDFSVIRGAEGTARCAPQEGVAPARVAVSVKADNSIYTGNMQLLVNDKAKSSFIVTQLDPVKNILFGEHTAVLKTAGRYYIGVYAEKRAGVPANIPNIIHCGDPSPPPMYCITGPCNYKVTNPGGGVLNEVAL